MNQYFVGLLGGLSGSVLTVAITKALDILQKSKEHKYSLEKIFFEKKLIAAEATMTQCSIFYNAMFNMSVLYERIDNERNEVEDLLKNTLVKEALRQMEIANNASFIVVNSISLYFDFDSNLTQNTEIRDFLNLLGSIGPLLQNLTLSRENYQKSMGTEFEKQTHEVFLKSQQNLSNTMKNVSESYKAVNIHLANVMEHIRANMRKFEY